MTKVSILTVAILLGVALGYVAERLPVAPVIRGMIAGLVAWLAGTAIHALSWFIRAESAEGIAAVSVGVGELLLVSGFVIVGAALIHLGLGRLGTAQSVMRHLPLILAILGSVLGVLGFTPVPTNTGKP